MARLEAVARRARIIGPRMRAVPSVVTFVAIVVSAVLVAVFPSKRPWESISLATGYCATALLLASLLVSPLYRLRRRRPAPLHLPLRRSLGVHAGLLSILHMIVSFPVHLGGDVLRYFFEPGGGLLVTRFGAANWIGLLANVLLVPLLVTSTNGALRRLGAPSWRRLHKLALPAALLAISHVLLYQYLRSAWVGLTVVVVASSAGCFILRQRRGRPNSAV